MDTEMGGGKRAFEGGAKRVELCSNLLEGGCTPSFGCVMAARNILSQLNNNNNNNNNRNDKCLLMVMIRPRGGDFCYDEDEIDVMLKDIAAFKAIGVDGVVFGCLTSNGCVDKVTCNRLIDQAQPMLITFHRAFDMSVNPFEAMSDLIQMKYIQRILTSGQETSASEGADLIQELIKMAQDRIIIVPGGGINERNLSKIALKTNAKEFHVSGRSKQQSSMTFRREYVTMGGSFAPPEFQNSFVNSSIISKYNSILNGD